MSCSVVGCPRAVKARGLCTAHCKEFPNPKPRKTYTMGMIRRMKERLAQGATHAELRAEFQLTVGQLASLSYRHDLREWHRVDDKTLATMRDMFRRRYIAAAIAQFVGYDVATVNRYRRKFGYERGTKVPDFYAKEPHGNEKRAIQRRIEDAGRRAARGEARMGYRKSGDAVADRLSGLEQVAARKTAHRYHGEVDG